MYIFRETIATSLTQIKIILEFVFQLRIQTLCFLVLMFASCPVAADSKNNEKYDPKTILEEALFLYHSTDISYDFELQRFTPKSERVSYRGTRTYLSIVQELDDDLKYLEDNWDSGVSVVASGAIGLDNSTVIDRLSDVILGSQEISEYEKARHLKVWKHFWVNFYALNLTGYARYENNEIKSEFTKLDSYENEDQTGGISAEWYEMVGFTRYAPKELEFIMQVKLEEFLDMSQRKMIENPGYFFENKKGTESFANTKGTEYYIKSQCSKVIETSSEGKYGGVNLPLLDLNTFSESARFGSVNSMEGSPAMEFCKQFTIE